MRFIAVTCPTQAGVRPFAWTAEPLFRFGSEPSGGRRRPTRTRLIHPAKVIRMRFRMVLGPAALLGLIAATAAPADKGEASKEALKALNEFVGQWKGSGENKAAKADWKESADWAWDLKGDEPALRVKFDGAKQFSE